MYRDIQKEAVWFNPMAAVKRATSWFTGKSASTGLSGINTQVANTEIKPTVVGEHIPLNDFNREIGNSNIKTTIVGEHTPLYGPGAIYSKAKYHFSNLPTWVQNGAKIGVGGLAAYGGYKAITGGDSDDSS